MGLRNRTLYTDKTCFFVTTTCYKWLKLIDSPQAVSIVANSITFLNEKYKAEILGYVIMPNHIHFIIFFIEKNRLSDYMRDFKKFTSVHIRRLIDSKPLLLEAIRHEVREQKFKVWQDRFDDVYIDSKDVLYTKFNYIHNNPLQEHWRLADIPENYPYSSAAFYAKGIEGVIKVTSCIEYFW